MIRAWPRRRYLRAVLGIEELARKDIREMTVMLEKIHTRFNEYAIYVVVALLSRLVVLFVELGQFWILLLERLYSNVRRIPPRNGSPYGHGR